MQLNNDPLQCGRCLDLGGVDGRLMALGSGHIGPGAERNLQATTQEPGTEAWLLSSSGKDIASCRYLRVGQGFVCACDGGSNQDKENWQGWRW